jgi:hypothetical protein
MKPERPVDVRVVRGSTANRAIRPSPLQLAGATDGSLNQFGISLASRVASLVDDLAGSPPASIRQRPWHPVRKMNHLGSFSKWIWNTSIFNDHLVVNLRWDSLPLLLHPIVSVEALECPL